MSPILRSLLRSLVALLFLGLSVNSLAQPNSYPFKVAQDRMILHDKVDQAQQRLILMGSGKSDSVIRLTTDDADQPADHRCPLPPGRRAAAADRIRFHLEHQCKEALPPRVWRPCLNGFERPTRPRQIPASMAPDLVAAFTEAMQLDEKSLSIEPVIAGHPYAGGEYPGGLFSLSQYQLRGRALPAAADPPVLRNASGADLHLFIHVTGVCLSKTASSSWPGTTISVSSIIMRQRGMTWPGGSATARIPWSIRSPCWRTAAAASSIFPSWTSWSEVSSAPMTSTRSRTTTSIISGCWSGPAWTMRPVCCRRSAIPRWK